MSAVKRFGLVAVLQIAVLTPALGLPVAPARGGEIEIRPHRAVYNMELAGSRSNSTVVQASGRLEFEWADACDGWTLTQRAKIEVGHNDGNVYDFGWSYSAWEAKDEKTYRFFIRRLYGGEAEEEVKGKATLSPSTGGMAVFEVPEAREVTLPAGTLFPSHHTIEVLEALQSGEMPLWREVFDGSGDEGIYGVSAAEVQELAPGDARGFASPLLADQTSWFVQLAFFGMDETQALPEQEQGMRLYANGIADQMTFDYGDFSVSARLTELEALPPSGC
ncbi:MAG TPA: DUF1849 family protein [Kiloniellaceae bacterium]|nr:DUF1849 family protein [Kiloniellaceae bacterium]